jgi:tRNA(Ile)-lysidine synthase
MCDMLRLCCEKVGPPVKSSKPGHAHQNAHHAKAKAAAAVAKAVMVAQTVAHTETDHSTTTVLLNQVRTALRKASVSTPGRPPRLLLAYSGGMDSTVLLHLLTLLRDMGEVDVAAAYYHHGWRGTPAPELPRLHKTALQWRVPLFLIPPEANETPTEAMARQYRYNKLSALALQWEADALLTAHHQDDQIETILFRLLRGTGLEGMEGIRHSMTYQPEFEASPAAVNHEAERPRLSGTVKVVRPLIHLSREQLRAHCQTHDLSFFEDPTNQQRRYSRNAIRHDIWPVIDKAFPSAGKALLRMAQVTRGDLDLLEEVTLHHWEHMAQPDPVVTGQWRLSQIPLSQLTVPHQRRLLRYWLKQLDLAADFADVERLVTFVRQSHTYHAKAPKLSMGVTEGKEKQFAVLDDGWLQLRTGDAQLGRIPAAKLPPVAVTWHDSDTVRVLMPGTTDQYLHIEPMNPDKLPYKWEEKLPSAKAAKVWVHLEKALLPNLQLRTRQTGDRIQPVGFEKDTSLKRYLIHQKVPQPSRDTLPLLATEQHIVWIPGLALSEALWVDACRLPTHTVWIGPMPITPKPRPGTMDDAELEADDEDDDAIEGSVAESSSGEGLVNTEDEARLPLSHDLLPPDIDDVELVSTD